MTQFKLFSSGIEVAAFVTSFQQPLLKSWSVISSKDIDSNSGVGISWKVYTEPGSDLTIIAFEATTPSPLDSSSSNHQPDDLVLSSELAEDNFLHFQFLCTKKNPVFSLHNTAVSLFRNNHQKLDQLKSQITKSIPVTKLIVTGHGIGGSVASLFTISLLDSIGTGKNRPLCVTFGSPLLGDKKLQQAISRSSNWNSCFLHVVSHKDPLPRLFLTNPTNAYTPFGTFLLCSDAGSTCFENPDSVLEILEAFGLFHAQNQGFQTADYGNIVENLNLKAICKESFTDTTRSDSLAGGISLQLQALGLTDSQTSSLSTQLGALNLTPHMQQKQENIDIDLLKKNIKKLEERFILQKRMVFDPSKKLNQMKGYMAQLEWYKKETKSKHIGYYDSYRNMNSPFDHDVIGFHKNLTMYWEKMVEEAETKPQKEGAAFRIRWLYAGTNYRRMVEPLAIAQYYKDGGKDYVTKNRSKHFKQLEEWLNEGNNETTIALNITSRKNVEALLTIDSCFWAHVEEALLSCKELKATKDKEEVLKKLVGIEEYFYRLLRDYAVSPEIFLLHSSYMSWWNEYKAIKGSSYTSKLANFMNGYGNIKKYASGAYDFP